MKRSENMKKKYIYATLLLVGLLIITLGVSSFNKHKELEKQKEYKQLLNKEKDELLSFLSLEQIDNIIMMKSGIADNVALTSSGKLYQFNPYVLEDGDAFFQGLFEDEEKLDNIISISYDIENPYNFIIKTDSGNVIYFHKSYNMNFSERYPDSDWKTIKETYKNSGKDQFYNYIDYTDFLAETNYTDFYVMNSLYFYDSHILIVKNDNEISFYETKIENGTKDIKKIDVNLDVTVLNSIQKFNTAGKGSRRAIALDDKGWVYARGIYGALEDHAREVVVLKIESGQIFSKLKLGEIQGEIKDFSSNPYYDIFITDYGTYLYGILPSKIIYDGSTEIPIELKFEELKYNDKSIIAKSVQCQENASCFIKTIDDEILYVGRKSYFATSEEVEMDKLYTVDYSIVNISNNDVAFFKTFTQHKKFLLLENGEIHFYNHNAEDKNKTSLLPSPTSYLNYQEYLTKRKQEYIDNIDQSIIDEYYESIKDTLPKGNIIK